MLVAATFINIIYIVYSFCIYVLEHQQRRLASMDRKEEKGPADYARENKTKNERSSFMSTSNNVCPNGSYQTRPGDDNQNKPHVSHSTNSASSNFNYSSVSFN